MRKGERGKCQTPPPHQPKNSQTKQSPTRITMNQNMSCHRRPVETATMLRVFCLNCSGMCAASVLSCLFALLKRQNAPQCLVMSPKRANAHAAGTKHASAQMSVCLSCPLFFSVHFCLHLPVLSLKMPQKCLLRPSSMHMICHAF